MSKQKNRNKVKRILSVFAAVIIIISVLIGVACAVLGTDVVYAGFKNLVASPVNNIKAAWVFITNDSDSIKDQIDANKKDFDEAVKNATGTELSDEVKAALESGKYTEEEMALIISGVPIEEIDRRKELEKEKEIKDEEPETVPDKPIQNEEKEPEQNIDTQPEVPPASREEPTPEIEVPVPEEPKIPEVTDDTAAIIAKMYIIKNKFMKLLENIEVDILNEYISYPKEERNPSLRKSIAGKHISTVASLEIQCDNEVEAVLAELKAKLSALGKDQTIIDTIRKAYADEKSLKKAYYMDIYLNGLRGKPVPKSKNK